MYSLEIGDTVWLKILCCLELYLGFKRAEDGHQGLCRFYATATKSQRKGTEFEGEGWIHQESVWGKRLIWNRSLC